MPSGSERLRYDLRDGLASAEADPPDDESKARGQSRVEITRGTADMPEGNRKDPRARVLNMMVRYKSATVDEFIENHSRDVSRGGMFIKTRSPFPAGTLLKFEVRIAEDQRLMGGVGRVVWRRETEQAEEELPPGMGIKFVKVAEGAGELIDQLVAARRGREASYEAGVRATSNSDDEAVTTGAPPDEKSPPQPEPTVPGTATQISNPPKKRPAHAPEPSKVVLRETSDPPEASSARPTPASDPTSQRTPGIADEQTAPALRTQTDASGGRGTAKGSGVGTLLAVAAAVAVAVALFKQPKEAAAPGLAPEKEQASSSRPNEPTRSEPVKAATQQPETPTHAPTPGGLAQPSEPAKPVQPPSTKPVAVPPDPAASATKPVKPVKPSASPKAPQGAKKELARAAAAKKKATEAKPPVVREPAQKTTAAAPPPVARRPTPAAAATPPTPKSEESSTESSKEAEAAPPASAVEAAPQPEAEPAPELKPSAPRSASASADDNPY